MDKTLKNIDKIMTEKKVIGKSQFADFIGISVSCLAYYLNVIYYDDLRKTGYRIRQKVLFAPQYEFLRGKLFFDKR